MKTFLLKGILLMSGLFAAASAMVTASEPLVCLGDSITDGYTYGQIITQALREAGKPVPTVICAGVASDTAPQMAARLDATVLRFKPKLVTFSAGTNDLLRGVTPEQYEASLREICEKVKASGATMILLTPCEILQRKGATAEEQAAAGKEIETRLDSLAAIVRKVAAENGWPVAENLALMRKAVAEGKTIMTGDLIHPDYYGQSLMARSILDAMGVADVPLPKTFQPVLFPGVIGEWQMRLAPLDEGGKPVRLSADGVAALAPDAGWITYTLPDPVPAGGPSPEEWKEQIRRNGFGCQLADRVGKGMIQAVAEVTSQEKVTRWVNLGGAVSTVWLNGTRIHDQGAAWTGYHAGKERIQVELAPGSNRLVLEIAGGEFFLSLTDRLIWEEQL